MAGAIFLVRHSHEGRVGLSSKGVEQSERARDTLLAQGLGSTTLLLSSNARRALQSAQIIGQGLGTPVHPSERLNLAGNMPAVVLDLDDFLADTLDLHGIKREEGQPLVVVTHAPLITVAKGLDIHDSRQIANGEVVSYEPGTWNAEFYHEVLEEIYAHSLEKP